MNKQFVRVCFPSRQTIADLGEAMLNDVGAKENVDYLVQGHQNGSEGSIELLGNGTHIKTVVLAVCLQPQILDVAALDAINVQAETMFREETSYGVKDADGIDRILGAIFNSFGGSEFYPGIIKKVAAYWYKIATTQMFHNGNKRTALLSAIYFLLYCGFTWKDVDGNELYEITVRVAKGEISQNDLEILVRRKIGLQYFDSASEAIEYNGANFTMRFGIDRISHYGLHFLE
ncbi:type II toxin-antitoxin system death-on-curing family toxin [Lacticaseibacillus jixiensis]|uniref:type II toxin-antitoxin system death-on-curing family toxin n=1 Tax=Lacticaseibacillus jixiensis TaxID=3231926 RepID=UPI0036F37972